MSAPTALSDTPATHSTQPHLELNNRETSPPIGCAYLKTLMEQGPSRAWPSVALKHKTFRPSPKLNPTVTLMTPPTTYDGDDELSEATDSNQSSSSPLLPDDNVSPGPMPLPEDPSPCQTDSPEHPETDEEESHRARSPIKTEANSPATPSPVDNVCAGEADGSCTLGSGDYRKVTSHIFGRNKRCTNQIPEDCWIKYCRKHYQRQKYRCPSDWFETQLLLIDGQLDKMEEWGGITSWTIAIRKKERAILDQENAFLAQNSRMPDGPLCRERYLVPHLGTDKTFKEVRKLIDVINKECDDTHTFQLPSFELLPNIDERRHPRTRRGPVRRMRKPPTPLPVAPETFRISTDGSGQLKTETLKTGHAKSAKRGTDSLATSITRTRGPSPGASIPVYAPTAPSPNTETSKKGHPKTAKRKIDSLAANTTRTRGPSPLASIPAYAPTAFLPPNPKDSPPRSFKRSPSIFDDENGFTAIDNQRPRKRRHGTKSLSSLPLRQAPDTTP
ncbi:MAG: hypothetical protein Q9220_002316 [cf. Caloplaca sp. 1 TL-2023]